jgi:hypothetical protein
MSLLDRDWYQKDLARRLRRIKGTASYVPPYRRRLLPWLVIALVTIVLAAPPTLTSRCDQSAWHSDPISCWQYSWQALSARVAGIVQTR